MLADLVQRYSEAHRAYHTLAHIQFCLAEFDTCRQSQVSDDAIELAIWYHDVIYDTRAKDNEEKSYAHFERVAEKARLNGDLVRDVRRLILATKHTAVPVRPDEALLVDIDLSILGQSEQVFDQYEHQIRMEYEWVPVEQFRIGRAQILQSFLDRNNIFTSTRFRNEYEAAARSNLARSIHRLTVV